jgi:chaperone required for assembly of F1-ATPase
MKNGKDQKAEAPSRFYSGVSTPMAPGGWRVLLDGRSLRTPRRAEFQLPTGALAEAIAEEWRHQGDKLAIAAMPLTKLANTALDAVTPNAEAVAGDVLAFARRDLICYRAEQPEELVERQKRHWDPLLAWVEEHFGAPLVVTAGVMPVDQPPASIAALRTACACLDPFALTALHVMTSLTGSLVVTLAHMAGRLSLAESWAAAHVDEDFQIEIWGEDQEASARRERRFGEMRAASEFFSLSRKH